MKIKIAIYLIAGFIACHVFVTQCFAFFDFINAYRRATVITIQSTPANKTPVPVVIPSDRGKD